MRLVPFVHAQHGDKLLPKIDLQSLSFFVNEDGFNNIFILFFITTVRGLCCSTNVTGEAIGYPVTALLHIAIWASLNNSGLLWFT